MNKNKIFLRWLINITTFTNVNAVKHNSVSSGSNSDKMLDSLLGLSKDELIAKITEMQLREEGEKKEEKGEDRLKLVQTEAQRRENVLFMRLTSKEQEVQEYLSQLEELRTSLGCGLRSALLDPVVNAIFQKLREELHQSKEKLEQAHQESLAWKFTPDSNTGKRLMAKCRSLIQENEELGRMIETGRLARLEGELSLSRKLAEDFKSGQTEMDNLLVDLDEDMDGLQATVMFLQKQLETSRRENDYLRQLVGIGPDEPLPDISDPSAGHLRSRDHHDDPDEVRSRSERSSTPSLDEGKGEKLMLNASPTSFRERDWNEEMVDRTRTADNQVSDGPPLDLAFADHRTRQEKQPADGEEEDMEEGMIGSREQLLQNGSRTPSAEERNGPTPNMDERDSPPPRKIPRVEKGDSPRSPGFMGEDIDPSPPEEEEPRTEGHPEADLLAEQQVDSTDCRTPSDLMVEPPDDSTDPQELSMPERTGKAADSDPYLHEPGIFDRLTMGNGCAGGDPEDSPQY